MKTALTDFALQKRGIYGILHVIILLLSLFLVISISVDTFKGIPFYTQSLYMKVQLWICILFLFDFILELFLSKDKLRYFGTHFLFLLVAIPYQNIIAYMGWTFSPEITYMLRFIPLVRGGYAMAIVVGWLTYNKASSLFISYLTMLLATVYFASLAGRVLSVLLAALGMMMFPIFTVYVTSLIQKKNKEKDEYYEQLASEKQQQQQQPVADK